MKRKLRLYIVELDGDFVDVEMDEAAFEKLKSSHRINIDDGGVWFAELVLEYPKEE